MEGDGKSAAKKYGRKEAKSEGRRVNFLRGFTENFYCALESRLSLHIIFLSIDGNALLSILRRACIPFRWIEITIKHSALAASHPNTVPHVQCALVWSVSNTIKTHFDHFTRHHDNDAAVKTFCLYAFHHDIAARRRTLTNIVSFRHQRFDDSHTRTHMSRIVHDSHRCSPAKFSVRFHSVKRRRETWLGWPTSALNKWMELVKFVCTQKSSGHFSRARSTSLPPLCDADENWSIAVCLRSLALWHWFDGQPRRVRRRTGMDGRARGCDYRLTIAAAELKSYSPFIVSRSENRLIPVNTLIGKSLVKFDLKCHGPCSEERSAETEINIRLTAKWEWTNLHLMRAKTITSLLCLFPFLVAHILCALIANLKFSPLYCNLSTRRLRSQLHQPTDTPTVWNGI